jgi:tetratricopeptide (TPR) repeat protein
MSHEGIGTGPRRRDVEVHGQAQGMVVGDYASVTNVFHLAAAAPSRKPLQLPADVSDFTDRGELVSDLTGLLTAASAGVRRAPELVVISGMAGVGKSALAVHVAHRVAEYFPDAQLYVDLGGAERPIEPILVLQSFLRAMGSNDPLPATLGELAGMYRSQLADKRALVVLDNAHDTAQVRPLLPGAGACAVLVTSRAPLAGLSGAHRRTLEVFTAADAVAFLARIIGDARVSAELAAADTIVGICGELPLAVRIAAGRLEVRPDRTLGWFADRLADQRNLLAELTLEDQAVRASLEISYYELPAREAGVFRQLAALPGPGFSLPLAAAASRLAVAEVEELLEGLLALQLLTSTGPDRYRFHDLVRVFAAERLDIDDPPDTRQEVANRAYVWLLRQMDAAHELLGDEFIIRDPDDAQMAALEWWAGGDEIRVLVELTSAEADFRQADERGSAAGGCNLGLSLAGRYDLDGAEAAYRRADERGHAEGAYQLGLLLRLRGDAVHAEAALRRADARGHPAAASELGVRLAMRGDLAGAEAALRRADERGDAKGAANLGTLLANAGDFDGAEAASRRAHQRGNVEGAVQLGGLLERRGDLSGAEAAYRAADERGSAVGATNLSVLLRRRGDVVGAETATRRGDKRGNARAAVNLGVLLSQRGDLAGAEEAWRRADERGSADGAMALGDLLGDRGDSGGAESAYQRASERGHAGAAFNVGVRLYERHDPRGAEMFFKRALELAVIQGDSRLADKAQRALLTL